MQFGFQHGRHGFLKIHQSLVPFCCSIEREIMLEQILTQSRKANETIVSSHTISVAIISCKRVQERSCKRVQEKWLPWCAHHGSPWCEHHGSHCFWHVFSKKWFPVVSKEWAFLAVLQTLSTSLTSELVEMTNWICYWQLLEVVLTPACMGGVCQLPR
jgi:hypothetical protein